MEEKTEGLLLQAIPYLGAKKILKIFTPEHGLVSLMAKKYASAPFLISEWVYKMGKEDLHLLLDASAIDDLTHLKQSYPTIEAAGQMAQDLLRTQLPSKKGPALYALTVAYLAKLPLNPTAIAASFRLKLLTHEGLLALTPTCARCASPAHTLSAGESLCTMHKEHALSFTAQEWEILTTLASARRISQLEALEPSQSILDKIGKIFENLIR